MRIQVASGTLVAARFDIESPRQMLVSLLRDRLTEHDAIPWVAVSGDRRRPKAGVRIACIPGFYFGELAYVQCLGNLNEIIVNALGHLREHQLSIVLTFEPA